ncbi:hypothetical protein H2200_011547 [Cladophialophora chaetospira]|uniref:Uncharacterized protein n=1 Tax=Cladophialophora chaetospira TaxID=386627 RepID=A0AA39CD93_9EURO|nr:hypothetical protein H2200_011547 [Cladophialophora chaetospira]
MYPKIIFVNLIIHMAMMATLLPFSTVSLITGSLLRSTLITFFVIVLLNSVPYLRPVSQSPAMQVWIIVLIQIAFAQSTYGLLLNEIRDRNWAGFGVGFFTGSATATDVFGSLLAATARK